MEITRHNGKNQPYTILIDRRDLALYRRYKWQRHTKGMIRYEGKRKGQGSMLLHREIMGVGPELYVLHRNGNKFDCRRENLEVITYQEQRQRQKRPFIRTMGNSGREVGVSFYRRTFTKPSGRTYTYEYADVGFCYRYKARRRRFCIDTLGRAEAIRRALAWRVEMICQHGLEPNPELLAQLDDAAAQAALEPPPKRTVKVKAPKPPKLPKVKLPKPLRMKPPKPPKAEKLPKPVKLPRLPKPAKQNRPAKITLADRADAGERDAVSGANPIMDLPDGLVAVAHETMASGKAASLLLHATDLHFYLQRVWQITGDGLLVSGLGRDQIRLHRLIVGAVPGERVVFRNGNTFDFRRDNLVLGGICRNWLGLTAHGVYPSYKGRGASRVLRGVRAVAVLPGHGRARERRAYREFSFEKYGEQEARRRAYTFRIESLRAGGQVVDPALVAELERITASGGCGEQTVSKRSADFFRLLSVGGALTK